MKKALTLARQSDGRLTLLHVLEGFPGESVYSGSGAFRLIGEYRARVEKVKRELRAIVPLGALNWCEVDTEAVCGIPHGSILAVALARNADLVSGSPRRTRLDRIVMASTVAGVLRRAWCPVMAIPETSSVTVASQALLAPLGVETATVRRFAERPRRRTEFQHKRCTSQGPPGGFH